ncbi:MAG: prenyltransferase [Anaerolineaceae bacterium]|nr:prenyltransferase [Anaerolineaceae bacterium]
MSKTALIFGPMRPPFLILAPACTLAGIGVAFWRMDGQINWWFAILCLLGAVSAHISVNALNEYFDFKSGLDAKTQRTPFSGGSGTLPANPQAAGYALATGIIALGIVGVTGIFFTIQRGWQILPLGLLGMLVIYIYTNWLLRSPLLSLLSPGLGFGTLVVMGTDFALSGSYSMAGFLVSLVPFFLVKNLLLLNQFPDVEADKTTNRRNYPITIGQKKSAIIFVAFYVLTYLAILVGVFLFHYPYLSLLGLLTLVLAIPASQRVLRYADDITKLLPALGQNVMVNVFTPLLVGIGFFIGV